MGIRAELEVVGKKGGEEEEVLRLFGAEAEPLS